MSARARAKWGVVVMLLGAPLLVVAVGYVHEVTLGVPNYEFGTREQFGWIALFGLLLATFFYAAGLPETPRARPIAALGALGASFLAAGALLVGQFALHDYSLPRVVVFGTVTLSVPYMLACRGIALGRRSEEGVVLCLVSDSLDSRELEADLASAGLDGVFRVSALTVDQACGSGTAIREAMLGVGESVLVLSTTAAAHEKIVMQAAHVHEAGIRVRTLVQFYDEWLLKLPVSELQRSALLFDISEIHGVSYARVKRLGDVALAGLLLPALALTIVGVWVANSIWNRGPLFYRQPRVGRREREFEIIKFRTMVPHSGPTTWTQAGDPRIMPLGRLLRLTHLDELPQILNVLRGEMSIVGPRPEQPSYVHELSQQLPYYSLRHLVRPGVSGWAQVRYPYGASGADSLQKLQYDFFYLRHQSLTLDLACLAGTLRSVLMPGAR